MGRSSHDSAITIYAELLSNIRQISVVASLVSASNSDTKAVVIEEGTAIRVHHGNHVETMTLPARAAVSSQLPLPEKPLDVLNWRLPMAMDPGASRISAQAPVSQAVPWTAITLASGSTVHCRQCSTPIVKEGSITIWKDLPSEDWAEMMEFWHCHKPHDHNDDHDGDESHQEKNQEHLTQKGYGASNAISARPGVGFVALTSFMLSESDCEGLSFSLSSPANGCDLSRLALDDSEAPRFLQVYCKACSTELGLYNVLTSSISLHKWQVFCKPAPHTQLPSSSQCLAITLADTISRSGSSKSIVLPHNLDARQNPLGGDTRRALNLWVLNTAVIYTSSLIEGKREAMRILYQDIDAEQGNQMADSITSDIQDISLPATAVEETFQTLELSNNLLPQKERVFKEWKVGLLERWVDGN